MNLLYRDTFTDRVFVFIPLTHPAYKHWKPWCEENGIYIVSNVDMLKYGPMVVGDYLFLISCSTIIKDDVRSKFRHVIVIHESALPKGRGWSPLAWQILEGKNTIPVSAITCADKVDSGQIIKKSCIELDGTELHEEIHAKSFEVKSGLVLSIVMDETLDRPDSDIDEQIGEPTYYPRRTPKDSEIDANRSIADQFNMLRICEPRFPAFFVHQGCKYEITLKKAN